MVRFSARFSPFYWYDPALPVVPALSEFPATGPDVAQNLSFLVSPQYSRIYLLEYLTDLTDPAHEVEAVIKDLGFTLTDTADFSGVGFIRLYSKG